MRDVVDKVLAEPIRPHFVIASVGSGFRLYQVYRLVCDFSFFIFSPKKLNFFFFLSIEFLLLMMQILSKLGSKIPIIISTAHGIIGKEVLTNEVKEVLFSFGFFFSLFL